LLPLAIVVIVFVEEVDVFLGHIAVGVAFRDEADDRVGGLLRAGPDAVGMIQDFGDGGGRDADRLHHGAQPAFDAFGSLDLAFARRQRHGAHLAHAQAHRIGVAAEFRVERRRLTADRRQRGLGGVVGLFFGGGRGAAAGNQRAGRIGRVFAGGHSHAVLHRHDGFKTSRH